MQYLPVFRVYCVDGLACFHAWRPIGPLGAVFLSKEVIAKLPPGRQDAAGDGEERRRGVVTTLNLCDEAIAPRREGGWDESFAIASNRKREE